MLKFFQRVTGDSNRDQQQRPPANANIRYLAGETNEYFRDSIPGGSFHNPVKPLMSAGANVFTMGSCFANEMRAYLDKRQIGVTLPRVPQEVLSLFHAASHGTSSWGEWNGTASLQYYNTFSLRQEIEKAAGKWTQDEDDYWQVPSGETVLYQCPYRRKIFASSPDDLRAITVAIDAAIADGLNRSELIVFTLGLTEVWRKRNNGKVACCEPGYCHGGGFAETEFVVSTFQQNLDNMRATIEVINQNFGHKQIVISVSPVPLGRTFRPLDAYVANMESKCILRCVAGAVDAAFDNVTYFPSFEMCMSDPHTFREDGRHVRQEKVNQIMELFRECHIVPAAKADAA